MNPPDQATPTLDSLPSNLPGYDLVAKGIAALARQEITREALLVTIGAPRLRMIGLDIPRVHELSGSPELALYAMLCEEDEDNGAHSRYNGLIRRLVSFERAAEAFVGKVRT